MIDCKSPLDIGQMHVNYLNEFELFNIGNPMSNSSTDSEIVSYDSSNHRITEQSQGLNKWHKKFNECVVCHTIERPHFAKGLCKKCYNKLDYEKHKQRYIARADNWKKQNPEKRKEIQLNYYYRNKEKCDKYSHDYYHYFQPIKSRQTRKRWKSENRDKINQWNNMPRNKISRRFSKRILDALAEHKRGRHWESVVGYTLNDLIAHLEKQFRDGMTWDNYGTVWHIDHKIPISWFNFSSYEDEEFKKCWALENLQPLFVKENLKKNCFFAHDKNGKIFKPGKQMTLPIRVKH